MTADDRTGSAPKLSPSTQPSALPRGGTQTASFDVGDVRLELTAAPGAARLVVADGTARDIYVVDPAALAEWSRAISWLLSLAPASSPTQRVEYRTPFLSDREGRPAIAIEGLVTEAAVSYRLIVTGADSKVAGVMTTIETLRGVAAAAAGVVAVARHSPG